MERFPKQAMMGRWNPGARHAQVLVKMKDVVGSMAEINQVAERLKVDFKMSNAYALAGKGYAVFSAFVELKDPGLSPDQLVAELKKSSYVLDARCAEGRESGVVDTLSFPVVWGDRRLVYLSQLGLANIFHDMQQTFGTGGDVILFKGGVIYGRDMMGYLVSVVGKDVLLRNRDYPLELFAASGWGVPETVTPNPRGEGLTLKLLKCFECEGRKSSRPMCHFVRGTLAGSNETLFGFDFECTETKCSAMGAGHCEFEVRARR